MLNNKIVVVTGATGALGQAVMGRVAAAGGQPVGIARKADAARNIRAADLSDAGETARVFEGIQADHEHVDALLNIAGGFRMAPATDADAWEAMWQMNLQTTLNATRAALPAMVARKAGSIASVAARVEPAGAQMGAYTASKSAVIRLTEALSAEVRDQGVRVNCVMPSIIDTPANREAMPDADFSAWVAPEALADVLVFLCSDAARAIHGAAIPVFGRS